MVNDFIDLDGYESELDNYIKKTDPDLWIIVDKINKEEDNYALLTNFEKTLNIRSQIETLLTSLPNNQVEKIAVPVTCEKAVTLSESVNAPIHNNNVLAPKLLIPVPVQKKVPIQPIFLKSAKVAGYGKTVTLSPPKYAHLVKNHILAPKLFISKPPRKAINPVILKGVQTYAQQANVYLHNNNALASKLFIPTPTPKMISVQPVCLKSATIVGCEKTVTLSVSKNADLVENNVLTPKLLISNPQQKIVNPAILKGARNIARPVLNNEEGMFIRKRTTPLSVDKYIKTNQTSTPIEPKGKPLQIIPVKLRAEQNGATILFKAVSENETLHSEEQNVSTSIPLNSEIVKKSLIKPSLLKRLGSIVQPISQQVGDQTTPTISPIEILEQDSTQRKSPIDTQNVCVENNKKMIYLPNIPVKNVLRKRKQRNTFKNINIPYII